LLQNKCSYSDDVWTYGYTVTSCFNQFRVAVNLLNSVIFRLPFFQTMHPQLQFVILGRHLCWLCDFLAA